MKKLKNITLNETELSLIQPLTDMGVEFNLKSNEDRFAAVLAILVSTNVAYTLNAEKRKDRISKKDACKYTLAGMTVVKDIMDAFTNPQMKQMYPDDEVRLQFAVEAIAAGIDVGVFGQDGGKLFKPKHYAKMYGATMYMLPQLEHRTGLHI